MVDGIWYIVIKGDYTGRVSGAVFDLSTPGEPAEVELTPRWEKCRLPDSTPAPTTSRVSSAPTCCCPCARLQPAFWTCTCWHMLSWLSSAGTFVAACAQGLPFFVT